MSAGDLWGKQVKLPTRQLVFSSDEATPSWRARIPPKKTSGWIHRTGTVHPSDEGSEMDYGAHTIRRTESWMDSEDLSNWKAEAQAKKSVDKVSLRKIPDDSEQSELDSEFPVYVADRWKSKLVPKPRPVYGGMRAEEFGLISPPPPRVAIPHIQGASAFRQCKRAKIGCPNPK